MVLTSFQTLSYSYYDVTPVGYIMARMTSDAQGWGDTIAWSLVDLAWGGFFMIASLTWMLILNFKLAIIIVALMPFLAVISFYFQQKILKHQREVRKTNSKITGSFNEGIMGARTTKTLVREEQNFNDFSGLTGRMKRFSVKAALFSSLYMPVVYDARRYRLGPYTHARRHFGAGQCYVCRTTCVLLDNVGIFL